jgi:hypothetical protein
MAIFGFVYLWYLMVVLLLEIWLTIVAIWCYGPMSQQDLNEFSRVISLGSNDISPKSVALDNKIGHIITVIDTICICCMLCLFYFGSIKANPW